MIIPAIILSSTLMLTACGGGSDTPTPEPSAASTPIQVEGYDAVPSDLDSRYAQFFYMSGEMSKDELDYYTSIGAKTYKEDPSKRSTTPEEWNAARGGAEQETFDKRYAELQFDVAHVSASATEYLATNPKASVDELNEKVVINRYEKIGSMKIEQDSKTGFYFAIFTLNDDTKPKGLELGGMVYQEGITPKLGVVPEVTENDMSEDGVVTETLAPEGDV